MTAPDRRRSIFASLRTRNYRLWFTGQAITLTGQWAQFVAQTILVLKLTDSGALLGVVTALQFLPILVIGPWAGLLADRLDKRRVLVGTQMTMMSTAVLLGVLELVGRATMLSVVLIAALTGIAFAFEQPARRTLVSELVNRADAPNAVSLDGTVNNVSKILGPALAGILISTVGIGWCFVVNGLTCLAALTALARMDSKTIFRTPRLARGPGQINDAFRHARSAREIRLPLMILTPVAVLGFNWNVLLPLLVTHDLKASATTIALVMSIMSVGSVGGTLWLARRPVATNRFLAKACITFGAANVLLALAPTILMAAAASAAVGAIAMVLFNGSVIGVQVGSEPAMRGRVMGIFSMVFIGTYGVGGPISGAVAEHLGARSAIALGAFTSVVVGTSVLIALPRSRFIAHAPAGSELAPPSRLSRLVE